MPPYNEETYGYCVYSHADWSYAYKSVKGEFDLVLDGDDIEGVVPEDLRGGVLYRNGPALFDRGGGEAEERFSLRQHTAT